MVNLVRFIDRNTDRNINRNLSDSDMLFFFLFQDVTFVPELFAVCLGFGWDRVNLFLSSWCSGAIWIEYENNIDNTEMAELLLSTAHQIKDFSESGSYSEQTHKQHGQDS